MPRAWERLIATCINSRYRIKVLLGFRVRNCILEDAEIIVWNITNEFIFIPLFGFFVGTLAVLLGIGCGLLIVPFFIIIIGFKIHEAIQLSLTTMFFLTFSATIVNNKFNLLDKVAVNILFFPALSGAFFGALLSSYLPASVLKFIFGGFLALVAIQSIADLLTAHLGKGPIIGKYYLTKITERRSK